MVRFKKISPELEAQLPHEIKVLREFYFSLSMEERNELDREDHIAGKIGIKTTKFCFECGKKINRPSKYCEFCGTKQIN